MHTNILLVIACAALVYTPACKSPTTADGVSTPPAADTAPPVTTAEGDEGKDPNLSDVTIDPRITEMCGIEEPNFAFNSASLSPQAKRVLNALAACFVDGKAAGMGMRLVGHADPRGDDEYNFGLGQQRADSVVSYLGKRGLERGRIESSSRGEMDAVGVDEAGWKKDRKVEILLADDPE